MFPLKNLARKELTYVFNGKDSLKDTIQSLAVISTIFYSIIFKEIKPM